MQGLDVDLSEKKFDLFDINKEFFVIDSNNLNEVESKLYGFGFKNGEIINNSENFDNEATLEGAYVYVKDDKDTIIISQDFMGSYGLYLYKEEDYFAISNSFLYLVDYLKSKKILNINTDLARSLLSVDIYNLSYNKTLISEIETLERNTVICIDKNSRKLKINHIDHKENSIDINSSAYFECLDKWYSKWINIIRNLKKNTNNITVDLTGGFDSRLTFLLFLGANINMNEICINSATDKLHTHAEDYEIASEISNFYGFKLNDKSNYNILTNNFSLNDILNISFYLKLGFHKQMLFKYKKNMTTEYLFGGTGGECIRHYYKMDENGYINRQLYFPYGNIDYNCLINSTTNIVKDSCNNIRKKFSNSLSDFDESYLTIHLFRETYCRYHFCRQVLEEYFSNAFRLCPLLDSDLHKLALSDSKCTDKDLLMAIIFTRYNKDILKFRFDNKREINPKTLEYAKSLNEKYPIKIDLPKERISFMNENNEFLEDLSQTSNGVTEQEVNNVIKNFITSRKTQKIFSITENEEVYNSIIADTNTRKYFPFQLAYPLIAIYKILEASFVSKSLKYKNFADLMLNEQINLISQDLNSTVNNAQIEHNFNQCYKNSFLQNIFSVRNFSDTHKMMTLLWIKFKFRRNK